MIITIDTDVVLYGALCLGVASAAIALFLYSADRLLDWWVFNKYSREMFNRACAIAAREKEKEEETKR